MANYRFLPPILAGGTGKMFSFIRDEIINDADHGQFNRSLGITREQVWIQDTPIDDFAAVSYEVNDPDRGFIDLTNSTDPFAIKFSNLPVGTRDVNFSRPMQLNERVLIWGA